MPLGEMLTVSAARALIVNVPPRLLKASGVTAVTVTMALILSVSTTSSYRRSFLTDDEAMLPDDGTAAAASSTASERFFRANDEALGL